MKTPGDVKIAGSKTCKNWQAFRVKLVPGDDPGLWQDAFQSYFYERLFRRYLKPIEAIKKDGTLGGEGFSIVAIQCTLIEFLESTTKGLSYRYVDKHKGERLGKYEYSDSKKMFVNFLRKRPPFAKDFNKSLARDFYAGVRCGLLHEAQTKKGWTISADGPSGTVICAANKTVYRNNFQDGLRTFINWYRGALPSDVSLQEAFIRKFDSLCQQ